MKTNRFQEQLAAGKIPAGHMIMEFATRGIARICDAAGLDFVVFDMEHSGYDVGQIADVLATCHGCQFAPFVRVPDNQYHFLARCLDAGALGVMVANVHSPQQAQAIVSATKYAPLGNRGLGLGTAHNNYIMPGPCSYVAAANANTTVICQIESVEGVANAEAIAAVEGVDVLWVGHYDLTSSMGILGEFEHPAFIEALGKVVASAKKQGKHTAIQPGNPAQLQAWRTLGFDVLSYSADIGLYRNALNEAVQWIRA